MQKHSIYSKMVQLKHDQFVQSWALNPTTNTQARQCEQKEKRIFIWPRKDYNDPTEYEPHKTRMFPLYSFTYVVGKRASML